MSTLVKKPILQRVYSAGMPTTLNTSKAPMSLNANEFPELINVRNRFGFIEARKSHAVVSTSGLPANAVFYGCWIGTIGGTLRYFCAVKNGSTVSIYTSTNSTSWTNLGSPLSDSLAAVNNVTFVSVSDVEQGDILLISDGATVVASQGASLVALTNATLSSVTANITATYPNAWDVGTAVGISGAVTGTTFAYTEVPGQYRGVSLPQIAIAATQANGDTVTITWTSGVSLNNIPQIGILFGVPEIDYDVFSNCKFEVSDGTTWTTVYDPLGSYTSYTDPSAEFFEDLQGFDQDCVLYTYPLPVSNLGTITRFRFTWVSGTAQLAAGTLKLFAAVASGTGISGVPDYAITTSSSSLLVESPAFVLDSTTARGMQLAVLGGVGYANAQMPISQVLRANWAVTPLPSVGQIRLYRRDTGSNQYLRVPVAAATTIIDTVDQTGLNPDIPAPSSYNTAPTGFTSGAFSNSRAFLGKDGKVMFSEYRFPLRFSAVVDPANYDRSSGVYTFASESIKAFIPLPGDTNLDRLVIATNQSLYSISGLDAYSIMRPGRISQYGTLSPLSLVVRDNVAMIVDDSRRIRGIGGINSGQGVAVKATLDALSDASIRSISSGILDDTVYFYYTPVGGSSNTNAFVLDLVSGVITMDVYSAGVKYLASSETELFGFMSNGQIWKFHQSGGSVAVSIRSREFASSYDSYSAQRHRVVCDSSNATITVTNYASMAADSTATLDLSDAGNRVDRFSGNMGARDRYMSYGFSGTVLSGWRMYDWQVENEGRVSEGGV